MSLFRYNLPMVAPTIKPLGDDVEIESGSTNVYADMGYPNADEMFVKAQLAAKIGEIIEARGWTQAQAADVAGIGRPKLTDMLNGRFRGISERKMIDCLVALGSHVQIVISPADGAARGRFDVVFA